MTRRALPEENSFRGKRVKGYVLQDEIGRGKIGVVYLGIKEEESFQDKIACKIIPKENLKDGWQNEIAKATRLDGIQQVVQYRDCCAEILNGQPYVCILWQYVDEGGSNLRKYIEIHPNSITISFIENLITELLRAFIAMKEVDVEHHDLHEGNIMIVFDKRTESPEMPIIKATDFGVAGSLNLMAPKDDYIQLARISHNLLLTLDPAHLNNSDVHVYNNLVNVFIPKYVLERNSTVGDFVRDPRKLLEILKDIRRKYTMKSPYPSKKLKNPFDYLRCEMMGESMHLLQSLYSRNFPGYQDLMRKNNTILTGPRGCGKTMIFRNMSLKTQILSGKSPTEIAEQEFVGFYYHCNDLYFAFPYPPKKITNQYRKGIITYFNLSVLSECLDTLIACKGTPYFDCDVDAIAKIQEFLLHTMSGYEVGPQGTDILHHSLAIVATEKRRVRKAIESGEWDQLLKRFLPLDFIKTLSRLLSDTIPWIKGKAIFFLLDDYSLPTINEELQRTLHDFILLPLSDSNYFFKIATESIVSFYPYNSREKMMEEGREYVVVDLGDYFLDAEHKTVNDFLLEVINNRLKNTESVLEQYHDVRKLLKPTRYASYNELARAIRSGRVFYGGWDMIVDLCSGDVAYTLDLTKDMLESVGGPDVLTGVKKGDIPMDEEVQDHAIRELGNNFLNRVEAIPNVGKHLRKVVESFGNVANWYLKNKDSKNVEQNPPWQAFRIEVRDTPNLGTSDAETYYNALIRYGVFIRDVKGKSQRGAVVPRLYLRKLLIPTFLLTPNRRDNIGLNPEDFVTLLVNPNKFKEERIRFDENQRKLPL